MAEVAIVKYVQRREFHRETSAAAAGAVVPKQSVLRRSRPTLSEDGLLCIGGRLCRADLPQTQKHPVILPKYHHIVDSIVRSYHRSAGHISREHTLSLLRERYWVVAGRQAVRRMLRRCFVCRRNYAKPASQVMADLPRCRLSGDLPPISFTGVDLFGPFLMKRGRSEYKRYGCLFTCMTVRAVHLEVTQSMDTSSFINALQRFMSRRGKPKEIWCDNGTNLVGAERELRTSLQEWNQQHIHDHLLQHQIVWHFNPPRASHMGGVWERMIRTVRKVLNPLLKEQVLDDEGLVTLLCMVESIVNSRPLTPVSDDPCDSSALTPNGILIPGIPCQLGVGDKFNTSRTYSGADGQGNTCPYFRPVQSG